MKRSRMKAHLSSLQHLPFVQDLHGVNPFSVLHLHHSDLMGARETIRGKKRLNAIIYQHVLMKGSVQQAFLQRI